VKIIKALEVDVIHAPFQYVYEIQTTHTKRTFWVQSLYNQSSGQRRRLSRCVLDVSHEVGPMFLWRLKCTLDYLSAGYLRLVEI